MATVFGYRDGPRGKRNEDARNADSIGAGRDIDTLLSVDVIPRLLVAHGRPVAVPRCEPAVVTEEDVTKIASLTVRMDAGALLDHVEEIVARGVPVQQLCVDLLAPAARRLGELWDQDELDFLQVSMGLWRLQEVLREVASRATRARVSDMPNAALFISMPGDNHTFGAAMVQECFSLAGWNADLLVGAARAEILDTVANRNIDLLGLTLSNDAHIEPAASLIRAIRSVSMNPSICIMVGGRVPAAQSGLATLVGADGTAETAAAAVQVAERLVGAARMAATA